MDEHVSDVDDARKDAVSGADSVRIQNDLRQRLSAHMLDCASSLLSDTVAIFQLAATEPLDADYCRRVAEPLIQLLAVVVRDGTADPRAGFITELRHLTVERNLSIERLFTFAYLAETAVLDELAISDSMGASSELWPVVAQTIRRASFDLLGAFARRTAMDPVDAVITDPLTTLHARPVLDAVLRKEVERASRDGHPFSLILFDVDHFSAINQQHGYGVGDRILERLGILIRTYFRQHDWVMRHSHDSIAVLLAGTGAAHANSLAERVRASVEERLAFLDHRSETRVAVTVTAAVLNIQASAGDIIDPERLIADVESAVTRGKRSGRNRVETVDAGFVNRTPPRSSPSV
jgi:diguanylate cyclase (GGDEF)-like protein